MVKVLKTVCRLRSDEKGATAIEYGLLAALVAVALVLVLGQLGTALEGTFQTVVDELG